MPSKLHLDLSYSNILKERKKYWKKPEGKSTLPIEEQRRAKEQRTKNYRSLLRNYHAKKSEVKYLKSWEKKPTNLEFYTSWNYISKMKES